MIPAMLVLDIFPEFGLDIIFFDTIPFSQYEFCKKIILAIHQMNMSILNLTIFSEMFSIEQLTIAEPLLVRDERHGIAMVTDGPPGNVMAIGEPHMSLSRGTPFSATVSKNIPAFC